MIRVKLHTPFALSDKGKRKHNEDCIFPPDNTKTDLSLNRLFLVCDGVGGESKGEEASRIACRVFSDQFMHKTDLENQDIYQTVQLTEKEMDAYIQEYPEADSMATTLAMLFFGKKGAVIVHLGDSRVYQIRDGEIIFRTSDHSLVQELISNNLITHEQAINHPQRNVITKALTGSKYPSKPDINRIIDLKEEDYFFLCTDGVLESFSDDLLLNLFKNNSMNDAQKMAMIKAKCLEQSRDNFSAYLVRIEAINKSE